MAMQWTNPSVLQFAGDADPVEKIKGAARELVFRAIENGWTGPPFDPFELAGILNHRVVPSQDVADAMLTPDGKGYRVDFNPHQSRRRIRFSIAHELAHTLFPDCREQVRHRLRHGEMRGDEWQLEMLCNIGAGEFLIPAGALPIDPKARLGIDELLNLQEQFDVSMEAVLLRLVRLERRACAVFVASVISDRYVINYSVETTGADLKLRSGLVLPDNTRVASCRALGYTAKGDEKWVGDESLHVECVAIPGYQGHQVPRVAGIVFRKSERSPRTPDISFLIGDATKPHGEKPKIIAHIVNDSTPRWGGAGFALAVRKAWPAVQDDFQNWATTYHQQFRLGHSHPTQAAPDVTVFSMIAQHGYGPSRLPRIRYHHLKTCLTTLCELAMRERASVHMPRIGCGEAGGNWAVVEDLIHECLSDNGVEVHVYDLARKSKTASRPQQKSLFSHP